MISNSVSEISLTSRAMLCSLSISMWSARKHDKDASEEIATRHGAQTDAGRYHKILLPKAALAEIQKIVSEARQEHYFMTLPWDDNGYRVLPAAVYLDHVEKMRALSNRFTAAVEAMTGQFSQLVEQARIRLGGLFCEQDYPALCELRDKFAFETKVLPLPDAGDFRVAMGKEEQERIKRQITAAVEASLQVGSRELWQRLYEAVSHMADRLTAYKVTEEKVEHPFRDSIVTNLTKLVDVLPKLNVTNDPELDRLAEQVRAALLVDPNELRKSDTVRIETAKRAADIAGKMSAYMMATSPLPVQIEHAEAARAGKQGAA
jgi:hypothetical protein